MKNIRSGSIAILVAVMGLWSCHKDLDRFPTNDLTSEVVYKDINGYLGVASKAYASMALTGSNGPGSSDLAGIDAGTSDFIRLWWKAQTLSTDEAVVAWNDPGIQDFHNMNWSSNNEMLRGLYNRCIYVVSVVNEFLRESTPEKLSSRGITGADATLVESFRNELRFIRAYQYWVLMDLFGNPPFITENDRVGLTAPPQISRTDLFRYIETELIAIEPALAPHRSLPYGRVDRGAAQALLSRLYLNANVYTGTPKWTEAITYAKRVIDAGYALVPNYGHLFLADNHLNTTENIFTIQYDGLNIQNYGGTTFIVHAQIVSGMTATQFGVNGGWSGIRATRALPDKFPENTRGSDSRFLFFTGNPADIEAVSQAAEGWPSIKFKNITRTGAAGRDPSGEFVDTDFPIFRLAEMYLNAAEAQLRGGGGITGAQALTYFNTIRRRAFGGTNAGDFTSITLADILDERSREMHWEGLRRTDLIRYGHFTSGTYLWPWKGGVRNGTGVAAFRNLYPIPAADLSANANLVQNPNY
ncbi:MAG TPA: RagB/SusD family nutrient uptake outer membrane protein [Phnomibacter sp.]|nr:RagB/SusD family nutrient uptake outer membrane protein [Phnomibacter sp.]